MTEKRNIHLTDQQYEAALVEIQNNAMDPKFKPWTSVSNYPGDKYTDANFGFCDAERIQGAVPGAALFPQIPGRVALKYREQNHRCPFDGRDPSDQNDHTLRTLGWGWGCFHKCLGHQDRKFTAAKARAIVTKFMAERQQQKDWENL